MSAEKINNYKINELPHLKTPNSSEEGERKRVDINDLLARARKKHNKENIGNLFFLGICVAVIVTTGIILSF
mgnify:CR=1 FL=1|tara:strand:- start:31 stop:246 length:216 start_codon:yes stop_codon:yes gene_type:complete